MLLTDYFRSEKDATWDIGIQCGVNHGVIRLPETADFDLTNKSHWQQVHKRFTDFGITPVIVEPMPNCVHDHIKAGDEKRDESIEQVIKMLPIMEELGLESICFNWMAHIGWLRTRSDIIERGGAKVTEFNIADFKPTDAKITAKEAVDIFTSAPPTALSGRIILTRICGRKQNSAPQSIPGKSLAVVLINALMAIMTEQLSDA